MEGGRALPFPDTKRERIAAQYEISGKVLLTGYATEGSLSYMPFLDDEKYTYDNDTNQLYAVTDGLTSKSAQNWDFDIWIDGYYSDFSITLYFPPDYIRSLLGENNNPAEIAQKISTVKRITEVRGHLVFAGTPYALNITSFDNSSLSGDVLTLPTQGTTEFAPPQVVGHISITTSKYEGELLSTGTLSMGDEEYNVLLTSPMAQGMMGRLGNP